jgi:hypothetical protein
MLGHMLARMTWLMDMMERRRQQGSRQAKGQPKSCEATHQVVSECNTGSEFSR